MKKEAQVARMNKSLEPRVSPLSFSRTTQALKLTQFLPPSLVTFFLLYFTRFSFSVSFNNLFFCPNTINFKILYFFILWTLKSLMETLQIPSRVLNLCRATTELSGFKTSGLDGRVGFLGSRQNSRKTQSFCLGRRSFRRNDNGGVFVCRSGSNAQDKKQEDGLVSSTERYISGSAVGFQLVPHSATSNDNVLENLDAISSVEVELSEDTKTQEKKSTRVTRVLVFVTSEASPYLKTGGLGDVCGALPIALAARGHRVMVVMPRYLNGSPSDKKFSNAVDTEKRSKIYCFGGIQEVGFFHEYRAGVDWVFVDHASFRRPGTPYGDIYGAFGDNQFRFTLLCYAACEAPLVLPLGGFTYGENCLFIANDWHAGLVPVLLAAKYRPYGVYKDARSIIVIHNIAHQGVEPASTYHNFGLPPGWYKALEWIFPNWARTHALDPGEAVNVLKAALVTADRIVAVSEGYSWEVTTPEGGYGLHELLSGRKWVLTGITNGIDLNEWNPSSDIHIHSHYSVHDLSGKVQCKMALQKELDLPIRPDCPLIGFIGRLDYQKGVDIILSVIPDLMQDDVQFVMLGSGEKQYEDWMRHSESIYREKFRAWVGFNVPISHKITAGCDILVMPSRFEPCGLNQLYAMKYGTVPVVHCTGGLRDTVKNFNPFANNESGEGTGWAFSPLTTDSLLATLRTAIGTYKNHRSSWEGLMKRGMERDSSWDKAATQYEEVFEWAFVDPPYSG